MQRVLCATFTKAAGLMRVATLCSSSIFLASCDQAHHQATSHDRALMLAQNSFDHQFCVVSHYSKASKDYAELATGTQLRYASLHGYGSQVFYGRMSGDRFLEPSRGSEEDIIGGGLYWQKVYVMKQVLQQGIESSSGEYESCAWALWMDSDAVITNDSIRLDDIVAKYAPPVASPNDTPIDIILSREDDHPVNAGVFMVRNTEAGNGFLDALMALYPLYVNNELPEQTAMGTLAYLAEPWPSRTACAGVRPELHPSFAVIPQRTFNSFYSTGLHFSENAAWKPGDFVAHFAGTLRSKRAAIMQQLIARLPIYG